jgi:hypothetical protein
MGDAIDALAAACHRAEARGDEIEAAALLLELAAALKEEDGPPELIGASPASDAAFRADDTVNGHAAAPVRGWVALRGDPKFATWPPNVLKRAGEVQMLMQKLELARNRGDYGQAQVVAGKLRRATAALEAAKTAALVPDQEQQ